MGPAMTVLRPVTLMINVRIFARPSPEVTACVRPLTRGGISNTVSDPYQHFARGRAVICYWTQTTAGPVALNAAKGRLFVTAHVCANTDGTDHNVTKFSVATGTLLGVKNATMGMKPMVTVAVPNA